MNGDGPTAVREIARNPVMLAETKMALPALKQEAARPAGVDGVRRVIGRRRAMYPGGPKTAEESAAWWADYYAVLADLPEAALEAGMSAHILDPQSEFMPKPGKLRALALGTTNQAVRAYQRAKDAITAATPKPPVERADPEAVKRMMDDYRAKVVQPQERARNAPPPTPVTVDDHGLSPVMRARLQREAV